MTAFCPTAGAFMVDRLTGRAVTVCRIQAGPPQPPQPVVAHEVSVREWGGRTISHLCELGDGRRFRVPAAWVTECPRNVVMLRGPQ